MLVAVTGLHVNVNVLARSVQRLNLRRLAVGELDVVEVPLRAGDVLCSRNEVVACLCRHEVLGLNVPVVCFGVGCGGGGGKCLRYSFS